MKKRHLLLLILPAALVMASGFVVVNSLGCNYELTLNHRDLRYYGVCRWGMVNFLESDERTGSKWSVSAFQISLADQLLFVIRERRQLREGRGDVQLLDNYNQSQSVYRLVNYAWMPVDRKRIAMFQVAPHHDVWIAEREGPMDLMDALYPRPAPAWPGRAGAQ
ncbi:hypothetical protein [Jeongeupia sp. USM3]|uniref:hypothetical protein n=1 Tax=Jeongeupia sp. USM3 TaxID=1906741 RepID=UPI00089DDA86|nr:hypothetical protein [Jeongeupia sp. USM3]AOY00236.1 hypothetical protein BJP62_07130 [Jeongeupia sp. USM3]